MIAQTIKPFFTVAIPVYNRLNYLKETINSVLNQDFIDFELLIIDDYSTDGAWDYIKSLKDPRIVKFRNDKNLGIVKNWTNCIEKANGRWFKFLMSDDIMLPYNLKEIFKLIKKHKNNFVIVTSGYGFNDENEINKLINSSDIIQEKDIIITDIDLIIEKRKKFIQTWANPAAYTLLTSDLKNLIKTENYKKVLEIYGNTGHCVDYFILYSVAIKYKTMIEVNKPLYAIRYHKTNLSKSYSNNLFYLMNGNRYIHYMLYDYKGFENFYIIRKAFEVYWLRIKNKKEIFTFGFVIKGIQLIAFIFYHLFQIIKSSLNKNDYVKKNNMANISKK